MNDKRYGFDYMPPNWRLYDLESGRLVVMDEDAETFWETVTRCKGIPLTKIEGFYLG